MQAALKLTAPVLPGRRIEISSFLMDPTHCKMTPRPAAICALYPISQDLISSDTTG
jgi:hypothetical protein